MRSMQIINWGEPLELRESETPKPAGSEVLVRVKSCGICHSDLHIWEGFFDLGNGQKFPIEDRGVHLPFTLGHEAAGIVVAMGPEAKGVEVGDSYAIYPWINCGECEPCENGLTQICDAPKIIGTRVNGAYSDYVLVPDARFLVEHTGISTDMACTLGCAGLTTFSAIRKIVPENLKRQDTVVVIGAGGLGLTAVRILKHLSKARVVVSDIEPAKRTAAVEMGADMTVDPTDEVSIENVRKAASLGNNRGVAATLDFVGLPQTMNFGLSLLRKGGHHIHVGLFGGAHSISLPSVAFRMLRISGSYVGTLEEFRELVKFVQNGMVLSIPVTTRPLEQAVEALNDLKSGHVVGRLVLNPET